MWRKSTKIEINIHRSIDNAAFPIYNTVVFENI